jgi:pimeloyl-ACP methyl ester carboxylesterase
MTDYLLPGLHVVNHSFTLPLDYDRPAGETVTVFAREVVATEKRNEAMPYLVFFQGGPGSPAPRPVKLQGWLKRALKEYRVLLLDQRGTGLSTPVSFETLEDFPSPQAQAAYLTHFRADNIVRDAEAIRKRLLGEDSSWSVLGQSFGGFCVMRYLSAAPEGLKEAYITGGIPSLSRPAEDVYRATYPRVVTKNRLFFERYPHAQRLCREIADYLLANEIRLPNGQPFTVEGFLQLGIKLGSSDGMPSIYYLLEQAFMKGGTSGVRVLSYTFLHEMLHALSYHTHLLFSILHEAIYCQKQASAWVAERVRGEFPEFSYQPGGAFLFTGEMIYPWMFEQYPTLKPLKEAAEILAHKEDWPPLYDLEVLAGNKVPVAAAVYFDDMYVEFDYSLETVKQVPNIKTWVTSEYEHDGLRTDGERVLDALISLLRNHA